MYFRYNHNFILVSLSRFYARLLPSFPPGADPTVNLTLSK